MRGNMLSCWVIQAAHVMGFDSGGEDVLIGFLVWENLDSNFGLFYPLVVAFVHFISIVGPTIYQEEKGAQRLKLGSPIWNFFATFSIYRNFYRLNSSNQPRSHQAERSEGATSTFPAVQHLIFYCWVSPIVANFVSDHVRLTPKMRSFGRFGNFSETFRSFVWDKT